MPSFRVLPRRLKPQVPYNKPMEDGPSSPNDERSRSIEIVESIVRSEGLIPLGIVNLGPMPREMARFQLWLDEKRHAEMAFLTQNAQVREDPRRLLEGAETAILVGLPYAQGDRLPQSGEPPRIAQYARLYDYHRVIWRKGEKILSQIHSQWGGPGSKGRVVTDSAPLFERALAAGSGKGFIGKNTCFISPQAGSMMLLGELLTTLQLPTSAGIEKKISPQLRTKEGGCGTCRRCQVHCPTGALDEDYRIDARKCLAYWTIEHRGPIPEEYWPGVSRYIFGCDICQIVCPYNRTTSSKASEELLKIRTTPPLFEIATMGQAQYERLFGGTPMTRAKRTGLMRNALIAMTVTKHPRLAEAIGLIQERNEGDVVNATLDQISRWIRKETDDRSR